MERIFEEAKRHEPWSSNLATFIRTKEKAPHFRAPENASDEEVIESYIQHHVENLSWLYEQVPIEIRDRTKNWYPGVNKAIKDVWMPRYEKTDAQIAGVIAVLSPQNEWGNNTSQAKRVLDIGTDHQDSKWSPEMSGTAARLVKGDKNLQALGLTEGKSLREVEGNFEKAIWIRIYDETYNAQTSASRVLLTPEGTWEEASAYAAKEIEALRSVLVPGETVTPGFDPVFKFEERTKKEGAIMELSEQVVDELTSKLSMS